MASAAAGAAADAGATADAAGAAGAIPSSVKCKATPGALTAIGAELSGRTFATAPCRLDHGNPLHDSSRSALHRSLSSNRLIDLQISYPPGVSTKCPPVCRWSTPTHTPLYHFALDLLAMASSLNCTVSPKIHSAWSISACQRSVSSDAFPSLVPVSHNICRVH
jgi:hypothetical protein